MAVSSVIGRAASRAVARRPRLLFAAQQLWLKAGYRFLDLRTAAWAIGRPEWLLRQSKREPTPLAAPAPLPASEYRSIARRMIASAGIARKLALSDDPLVPEESMWGTIRQIHYRTITGIIESGDDAALAEYLAGVFRTETVDGYTYGTWLERLPHQMAYLPVNIELSVVTLAEYLAILRPEQHEQGNHAYWRSEMDEAELISRIEKHVGFAVEHPRIGDPRGIWFGGRFLTRETCTHLYSALRMSDNIARGGLTGPLQIVEIGGGYGGVCHWLHRLLGKRIARYSIVDLPEVALIQAAYLDGAGHDVALRGEAATKHTSAIRLTPHFELEDIDFTPNVIINQDSMPEMDLAEVRRYIAWSAVRLKGLFLSYNQEAYAPFGGVPQVHVPKVFAQFPQFTRLSRETSWSRRGYVEEVYDTRKIAT